MKKYLSMTLATLLIAFALTACGGNKSDTAEITVSASDLAKEIVDALDDDTLSSEPVVSDILASTYFVDMDQIEDSAAYMSTGATASEVAVIKCKDAEYATEVADLFTSRTENQASLFASYAPEEVTKLENALIQTSGCYVVLCVADDTAPAETVLEDAFD
jgi:hypothetical protein